MPHLPLPTRGEEIGGALKGSELTAPSLEAVSGVDPAVGTLRGLWPVSQLHVPLGGPQPSALPQPDEGTHT